MFPAPAELSDGGEPYVNVFGSVDGLADGVRGAALGAALGSGVNSLPFATAAPRLVTRGAGSVLVTVSANGDPVGIGVGACGGNTVPGGKLGSACGVGIAGSGGPG